MTKRIEEIQEAVRALRDDDAHVCPADVDGECTCHGYDAVIDMLGALEGSIINAEAVKEGMRKRGITAEQVKADDFAGWTDAFCDTLEAQYELESNVRIAFENE